MPDVVSKQVRSRMMSGIRGKNTKPELALRSELHRRGFRYRLYDKALPGQPDMVFPRFKAVILVNGCFWHGHDCHLFKWPSTRADFWHDKIIKNKARDERNLEAYQTLGLRTLVVWECSLKGKSRLGIGYVAEVAARWLQFDHQNAEISGSVTIHHLHSKKTRQ